MENPHTSQLSPQPPSSRWCLSKNSHPFLEYSLVSYVSPTRDKLSSANCAAYVKQIPQLPTHPPFGCCARWRYSIAPRRQFLEASVRWPEGVGIAVDSLDFSGSVPGVVFPKDCECCKDRSRAFWVVVLDHNSTCNIFRHVRSKTPLIHVPKTSAGLSNSSHCGPRISS